VRIQRRQAHEPAAAPIIDEATAEALANINAKLQRLAAAEQALEVLQAISTNWMASGDEIFVLVPETALEALVAAIYGD
jgi:hypothetical protein